MRLRASFALALKRLCQRPVRTVLLLQGTIWGVAVAVFPSAVIQGTREGALDQGARLGADRIAVVADSTSARAAVLRRDDLDALRAATEAAQIEVRALGGVRLARSLVGPDATPGSAGATLLVATPGAEEARGLSLAAGRWLTQRDGPQHCVVEADVGAWLGRDDLIPGDRIRPPGLERDLEVVGVAAARSALILRTNDLGFDLDHALYKGMARAFLLALGIPLVHDDWKRTDRCLYVVRTPGDPAPSADDPLDWIFLRSDSQHVSQAAEVARAALARRDKAAVTLYPLVLPLLMSAEIDRFGAVNIAMFLACLVMGAVVMMNFGLLNVLTRSREIAIRRTEGATRADITRQFLAEGLLLSVVGAALGCALGAVLAEVRARLAPITVVDWTFPLWQAAAASGVAITIGLLASALPAIRAARQDPVEGLADE